MPLRDGFFSTATQTSCCNRIQRSNRVRLLVVSTHDFPDNLDNEYAVSDICCANGHCRNKSCKFMTKPRRYGGKSHPGTPTQEQTRPITTETSKKKYPVFDISCKDELWKNKRCKLITKRRRYSENLIPRRQLRSKRDQKWRKLAI